MMLLIKRLLLAILTIVAAVTADPFGIQSNGRSTGTGTGTDRSSYAGALSYDSDNHVVFVTGATYGSVWSLASDAQANTTANASDCFFAILKLPVNSSDAAADAASWLYSDRLGTANVVESCSSILRIDSSKVYIGGHAEEGGLLTSLRKSGSDVATQYGTILDMNVDLRMEAGQSSSSTLLGGRLFHEETLVQSTRAMTAAPFDDALYTVSQASDGDDIVFFDDEGLDAGQPNWVTAQKFGRNYILEVSKIFTKVLTNSGAAEAETLQIPKWNRQIATVLNPVDVAGLELMSSTTLLLAGSAIGSAANAIPPTSYSNGTDWAGFVTLLNSANGLITKSYRLDVVPSVTASSIPTSSRIEGICRAPNQEDIVYLVGSTNGVLELDTYDRDDQTAFLIQLKVPNLTIGFVKQLDAKLGPNTVGNNNMAAMLGHRCAVTEDGTSVYVGGVVKNGAIVNNQPLSSKGKDDIFVGLVDVESQEWKWIRQLGTSQDESLADLTVDKDGHGIVLGNSRGSFMRQKSAGDVASDVFIIALNKYTGNHAVAVEEGGGSTVGPTTAADPVPTTAPATIAPTQPPAGSEVGPTMTAAPLPTEPPAGSEVGTAVTAAPLPTSSPTVTQSTIRPTAPPIPGLKPPDGAKNNVKEDGSDGSNTGAIAVAIVVSIVGIIVCLFIWQNRFQFGGKDPDGAQILDYLKGFDDVEVDLKHSATGGFHGTYVNHDGGPRFYSDSGLPPEETVNFRAVPTEMSSLTHSSIVQDSLFSLEDDEGPNFFAGAESSQKMKGQSSYRGLVDVYNHTWNERSQHRLPDPRSRLQPLVDVDIDKDEDINANFEHKNGPGWGKEII